MDSIYQATILSDFRNFPSRHVCWVSISGFATQTGTEPEPWKIPKVLELLVLLGWKAGIITLWLWQNSY